MNKYVCWEPDSEDVPLPAGRNLVEHIDAAAAAEEYADGCYLRCAGESMSFEIAVRELDSAEVMRFEVKVDFEPTFHATPLEVTP